MDDPLDSARAKFARANLHKGTAKREAVRLFNRYPAPSFRIEPEDDSKSSVEIGAVNRCNLIHETAGLELPASFPARFGDAIYNYRCVLDHIAWQLVRHGSRWPLEKRQGRDVQFPIYETSNGFTSNQGRRLPGVHRDVIRYIKGRHKYIRGKATNNGLLELARLCNDDKHREIRLFFSVFRSIQANVTFDRCFPVSWDNPVRRPLLEQGAVVTRFSYRVTGANPKVTMNLTPQVQIVDEHWRDFSEMLEGISAEVREILNAPEIVAAVSRHGLRPIKGYFPTS